jgi:antitoxin HicB
MHMRGDIRSFLWARSDRDSLKVMATRRFRVLIEWDPDDEVWATYVPSLGHLSTYGESRQEALTLTREAVLGYLEAAATNDLPVPEDDDRAAIVEIEVAAP